MSVGKARRGYYLIAYDSQLRKFWLLGSVGNMGEGGQWISMSVAIAGYGVHDETQISRGSGPRGPSSAFPGRSPHLLTTLQRYDATHARALISP
jgi:hypothetical protein